MEHVFPAYYLGSYFRATDAAKQRAVCQFAFLHFHNSEPLFIRSDLYRKPVHEEGYKVINRLHLTKLLSRWQYYPHPTAFLPAHQMLLYTALCSY